MTEVVIWEKINDEQWISEITKNKFCVLDISLYEDYYLQETEIDLSKKTEKELDAELYGYYDSLEDLKKQHPDSWRKELASIIASNTEVNRESDESFETENELSDYMKSNYNIKLRC